MEEVVTTPESSQALEASDNINRTSTMVTQPSNTSLEVVTGQRYPGRQETTTGGESDEECPILSSPHDSSSEDEGSLKLKLKELTATCTYLVTKMKLPET
jgi:hypothetical protein